MPVGASSPACLSYYPAEVTLKGALRRQTFPGPPNFKSVAHGDESQTGFYLHLEDPVCTVSADETSADRYPVQDVPVVQLVLSSSGYQALQPCIGRSIAVRGQLFASFTGHHHARLLLRDVWAGQEGPWQCSGR